MQINRVQKNNPSFSGLMNNKLLLGGLEKVAEHGATFAAGLSVAMPLIVRPVTISLTPDVEKENKHYACSHSIGSGLVKLGLVAAVSLPLECAVKAIDNAPEKFLKPETIRNLQDASGELVDAKAYKLMSQMIKLGTGFLTAIPKSTLTVALIPLVMDKFFNFKLKDEQPKTKAGMPKQVSFKGAVTDKIAKLVGRVMDNEAFQKFAKVNEKHADSIPMHIMAATDVLLTGATVCQTSRSEKIDQTRKKALTYNNVLSTAATVIGGYGINKIVKEKTESFMDYFSQINKGNPKLEKYKQGINIVRPAIIFAALYYCILPMFSTYFAEKIDKFVNKK